MLRGMKCTKKEGKEDKGLRYLWRTRVRLCCRGEGNDGNVAGTVISHFQAPLCIISIAWSNISTGSLIKWEFPLQKHVVQYQLMSLINNTVHGSAWQQTLLILKVISKSTAAGHFPKGPFCFLAIENRSARDLWALSYQLNTSSPQLGFCPFLRLTQLWMTCWIKYATGLMGGRSFSKQTCRRSAKK